MAQSPIRLVETTIFSLLSLVCINSAYHLYLGPQAELVMAPASDARSSSSLRQPAPVPQAADPTALYDQFSLNCAGAGSTRPQVVQTKASKFRILGKFCGQPHSQRIPAAETIALDEVQIQNVTSHYTATVFIDHHAGRFSTDFIMLDPGRNQIKILFQYKNKRSVPLELTVVRPEI